SRPKRSERRNTTADHHRFRVATETRRRKNHCTAPRRDSAQRRRVVSKLFCKVEGCLRFRCSIGSQFSWEGHGFRRAEAAQHHFGFSPLKPWFIGGHTARPALFARCNAAILSRSVLDGDG